MKEMKPVNIRNGAFTFCKWTIAALLWGGLLLQNMWLVVTCFIILVLSILLKVSRAPLVFLYTHTVEKFVPSRLIVVDENAVRFAHVVGAVFAAVALILFHLVSPLAGWIVTGLLAILKTSGAFGLCGAMKLYTCLSNPNGQCCRTGRKIKSHIQ